MATMNCVPDSLKWPDDTNYVKEGTGMVSRLPDSGDELPYSIHENISWLRSFTMSGHDVVKYYPGSGYMNGSRPGDDWTTIFWLKTSPGIRLHQFLTTWEITTMDLQCPFYSSLLTGILILLEGLSKPGSFRFIKN
jgi:hypothetical protein